MDFAEVHLLMRQFIDRKRAEAGDDDEPTDPASLELLELIGKIREEKRSQNQTGAGDVSV